MSHQQLLRSMDSREMTQWQALWQVRAEEEEMRRLQRKNNI